MRVLTSIIFAFQILGSGVMAQPLFGDISHDWRGKGLVRAGVDAPIQKGICKVTTSAIPEITGTLITGKCSSPTGASKIAIRIEDRGDGKLAALFTTKATNTAVQFLGNVDGTLASLNAREPQIIEEVPYNSTILMTLVDDQTFTLKQTLKPVDGEDETVIVEMKFLKVKAQ